MKAVVFQGKERLSVESLPAPRCGPGEALLRVAACGICGGDARSFFQGDKFTGERRIPGHEAAGVIEAVGEGAARWKPGDRVALAADVHCGTCYYCRREMFNLCDSLAILGKHMDGGLADCMLLTKRILDHGIIHPIPEGLPMLHAALSEPLCSVLASHDDLAIAAGETVAVVGSGPMGILHLELLRARGARVIVIARSGNRLARARDDFGAGLTIEASREDPAAAVKAATGGVGADCVIVAAPSAAAVANSLQLVRKRGRIGLFGGLPAAEASVALDINRVHYSELRLVGNFSYHPRYHRQALELLASGAIRADKLITTYAIEETEKALYDIRGGRVLKAVVIPNQGALL